MARIVVAGSTGRARAGTNGAGRDARRELDNKGRQALDPGRAAGLAALVPAGRPSGSPRAPAVTTDPAQPVLAALAHLGISCERHDHPPVFTVSEAMAHWVDIDAAHCKNLFLRNAKGTRHYLVVVPHAKAVDLRALAGRIGDDRLSFASAERLMTHLGLTPGSVSPFGLINDAAHDVQVVVDADLRQQARVAFHPNVNTATLVLSFADFERFLASCGNPVRYLRL
jgi:Ala-tRNA(Pro) deacylase